MAYVQLVAGAQITEAELIAWAGGRISERAAIPKEIFILDKLPLTTVGKPLKVDLRLDAAERAFKTALSATPGLTSAPNLQVLAHPQHGSLVAIRLDENEPNPAEASQGIRKVMDQYAFAYEIEGH